MGQSSPGVPVNCLSPLRQSEYSPSVEFNQCAKVFCRPLEHVKLSHFRAPNDNSNLVLTRFIAVKDSNRSVLKLALNKPLLGCPLVVV